MTSRSGKSGAVDSREAAGGNRSSSVRGPGAGVAPATSAAGGGAAGANGESNAADNATEAALIAANADCGNHGGGSGKPTADGVGAECAANGGGGAATVMDLATGGGAIGAGGMRATGRGAGESLGGIFSPSPADRP